HAPFGCMAYSISAQALRIDGVNVTFARHPLHTHSHLLDERAVVGQPGGNTIGTEGQPAVADRVDGQVTDWILDFGFWILDFLLRRDGERLSGGQGAGEE